MSPRRAAGRAGHLPDRRLEGHHALVAHELAEDARERAPRPRRRLRADERRVGPDHRQRVGEERSEAPVRGPGRDLVRSQVLGDEQVADGIDDVRAGRRHELAERPALPRDVRRRREVAESEVVPGRAAGVGRAALAELVAQPLADRPVGDALERSPAGRRPGPRAAA